jgi:hypothetical protein
MLLPLFLLAGCETMPTQETAETTTPPMLAARLPPAVHGFVRGTPAPLTGREGVEIPFSTRGIPAAAAIIQLVPATGALGDPAPTEAALAGMVRESMQSRTTRRVRDRGPRFTLPAEGPARLVCAETEGTLGRQRVEGLLCAGRFTGSLAQIRVTMPLASPPPADARAFASAVALALATRPATPPAPVLVGPPALAAPGVAGAR